MVTHIPICVTILNLVVLLAACFSGSATRLHVAQCVVQFVSDSLSFFWLYGVLVLFVTVTVTLTLTVSFIL